MSPKPFLETGKGIIETGNGIILPTYRLLFKKNSFTKVFLYNSKSPNQVWETGNRIIETGNGIILPTYRILIKKLLLQKFFYSNQRVQTKFWKQEIELLKQEMESFNYLQSSDQKTSFTKYFPSNPRIPKPDLETEYRIIDGIIGTGNGIILPTSGLLIKKLLLQNIFHSTRRVQNQF